MKQPKAIIPIFFTELWERFGYYSIQGLLVIYLTSSLHFSDTLAFSTLGEFISWIYIAPVFGGLLANRVLGYRYCILTGAILLFCGYTLLAFSGHLFLHLSLTIIILGNGLLKPNAASFLGLFYYHDDPRRYPGFTFYFIGINIGGLAAIIMANLASRYFGYDAAFWIAAAGMLIAIAAFIYGYRFYENRGFPIDPQQISSPWLKALTHKFNLIILLLIIIQVLHFLLHSVHISTILLILVALCVVISLFYIQATNTQTTRNKLIAVVILTSTSIIFWAENLQIFFSMILFTDRYIDRTFFQHPISPSFFVILEPTFLLLIGPVLARLWGRLSERNRDPSPTTKFAAGLLIVAIAMLLLAIPTYTLPTNHLINPLWLVGFYVLMSISALLISPTGIAMITELAPAKLTGFMMGAWYMVIGLGGLLASLLARLTIEKPDRAAEYLHPQLIYGQAFIIYALIAAVISGFLFLIAPSLKRLMYGSQNHNLRL